MSEEEIKTHKKGKKDGAKLGAVIILVISAIVFIPTGGTLVWEALANSGKTPVFGSYKGKKIEYKAGSEFADRVSYMAELYKAYGQEINQTTYYSIFNGAFEGTLRAMIFSDAVKRTGWEPSANAINREILPRFLDENGNYSQKIYNQTDSSTRNQLRKTAAANLSYDRYNDDIMGSSVSIAGNPMYGAKSSSKEKGFIGSMACSKRSFELAAFNTANFPNEEAVKYGKTNPGKFRTLDISAVTLESQDEAKSLLKQLQNNEITFEDAVSEKSTKYYTDKDGNLSEPYYYQLALDIENSEDVEKVIALSPAELSSVIQTKRGWTIYRVNANAKEPDFNDEGTVGVVLEYLKANEKGYIENYYIDQAKAFINEAKLSNFQDACEKFGITKTDVQSFPINYGNSRFYAATPSDVSELIGLSTNESVLQTLFSTKKDDMTEPFVLGSSVIVARCTGLQKDPPAEMNDYQQILTDADNTSSQATLKNFEGVEDNFMTTYFKYFLSGNDIQ